MSDLLRKRGGADEIRMLAHSEKSSVRPMILAVGETRFWKASGRFLQTASDIAFAEFSDISSAMLLTLGPDIVVSPMITRSFDCLDLAQVLFEADFCGRYRIVSAELPNPRVLLSEIASHCPGLDVDVIVLDRLKRPNTH